MYRSEEALEYSETFGREGWSLTQNHMSSDSGIRLTVFEFMNRQRIALREAIEICKADSRLFYIKNNLEAYVGLIIETYNSNKNLVSAEDRRALNTLPIITSNNSIRFRWLRAVNERIAEQYDFDSGTNISRFMYREFFANDSLIEYTIRNLADYINYSEIVEEANPMDDFIITALPETRADADFSLDRVASRAVGNINRWDIGFIDHGPASVKLNGKEIRVSSVRIESEPGGLTRLGLEVLIVPGSDTINFTSQNVSSGGSIPRSSVNSRYLDL